MRAVRRECSDLLELSDLLNLCGPSEREFYQDRLTRLIEQLGYYIRASELIENEGIEGSTDTPMLFIDNLFNKLRISGFVYHPGKNFNILSSLFLRRPDLMNNRIKELLDIIKGKDIIIWKKEPFRSALVKLLELYIRESDGQIDKTKDNHELIKNNMAALAIQLLLLENSKDTSTADYRLNTARLCTISSYLQNISPVHLVDVAYYCLFHSVGKRISYGFDSIGMIPHYVASMYPCGKIDTVNSFVQNNTKLLISSDGISLQPLKVGTNKYPIFPKELSLWQGLQVYLNSKPETSLTSVKANDIRPYIEVWKEIEGGLFNTQAKNLAVVPVKKKKQHRINEIVNITFVSQDLNDKNKYYCQIEDEIGGQGFIYVKDIVPYPISTSLRYFFANDGSRFVFEAEIIEIKDGFYHFSMLEIIKESVNNEYYSDDEDIICSVGAVPNVRGEAPAISTEGVSVTLRNAKEFAEIGKNNIVSCHLIGKAAGSFHIQCDINELTSYDYDLYSAFKYLMESMSIRRIPESLEVQKVDQILDTDKVLDELYVREVIYFIDRIAILDNDYIKSYNYLAFARVLCMMIGWESQAAYYQGRMDIITMLHDFAKNEKVDEEKLSNLENSNSELFSNNILMRERFMQLQTVSYLGNPSHNDDLYKMSVENLWLKDLALLCLAYNITKQDRMEKTAINIHNRIKMLLNLKGFETGLKQYGTGGEGIAEEYKSSIVFPAGEESIGPNLEKQMNVIMKVINSFLNTVGGTLYIGVNNFGLGVGVEEDLNSSLFYGDKDKYLLTINNAVASKWGNFIASHVGCLFDSENKDKDIVVVKIKPLVEGIDYDGVWYVRVGNTTRKFTKDEYEDYKKYNRSLPQTRINDLQEKGESVQPEESDERPLTTKLITSKDDVIKTSRIRKNVLKDWDDPENYVEPIAFFKFLNNGKFKKMDSYDYDEESLLTLVVKENEGKGYLILGYENGCIVKVSVEDLLEYQNRDYSRNTESKLIFASLARDDDAVLIISKEDKTKPKILMRLDRVSEVKKGGLNDCGERPFNEGLMRTVLAYDIIPSGDMEDFRAILGRPKTSLGYPVNDITQKMVDKLHQWGIKDI